MQFTNKGDMMRDFNTELKEDQYHAYWMIYFEKARISGLKLPYLVIACGDDITLLTKVNFINETADVFQIYSPVACHLATKSKVFVCLLWLIPWLLPKERLPSDPIMYEYMMTNAPYLGYCTRNI